MTDTEITIKMKKLGNYLNKHDLDGVLLTMRRNFAWITGGKDNHIPNNSPQGVATIFATKSNRVCLANSIEAPRMKLEELKGTGIEVIEHPWWDPKTIKKMVADFIGKKRVAHDGVDFGIGLKPLADDFNHLRWQLTDAEVKRFRKGAQLASAAMEAACYSLKPGMSEHEIAGMLDHCVHAVGTNPVVTLVAGDGRIAKFRHPIPTDLKVKNYVMLVCCAEFGGLISNLTRFVSFRKLSKDLKARQQAIANIDTAVNLSTRPGRTVGEVFRDLQTAYAVNGHEGQWQFHHQGGPCGYMGREAIANPWSADVVLDNQAYAWNPSIVGIKCEDTILTTKQGIEVLTSCSKDWPQTIGHFEDYELARPDVLVK